GTASEGGGGGGGRYVRAKRKPGKVAKSRHRTAKAEPAPVAPAPPRYTDGDQKVRQLAQQLSKTDKIIVIEGYADANNAGAVTRANDRANIVRNQLIDQGVAPARIKIETKVGPGNAERVRLVAQAPSPEEAQQQQA